VSPLSLLTFFAAAKKVSAAPHRGNANKPIKKETPNAVGKQKQANAVGKQHQHPKGKTPKSPNKKYKQQKHGSPAERHSLSCPSSCHNK
jgi:hypothetical protein